MIKVATLERAGGSASCACGSGDESCSAGVRLLWHPMGACVGTVSPFDSGQGGNLNKRGK